MPSCRDPVTQTCRPTCTTLPQTCNNGTCSCHWSSQYNFFEGVCVSRCAPWPQTTNILPASGSPIRFGSCVCAEGYSASEGCRSKICLNGGVYYPITGQCVCPPGWTGPRCLQQYCSGNGVFNNGTSNNCTCFFPWSGPNCGQNVCQNGGSAVENPLTAPDGSCECPLAYRGPTCGFNQCGLHGRPSEDGNQCICEAGWFGVHCQVFGCYEPNKRGPNDTCICAPNRYGPACAWLQCGPAGDYVNGTCICGGVSLLRNTSGVLNCTGNSCGAYGIASVNLATCFCNDRAYFLPTLDANYSFNCVPKCQNGGTYNNTVPIGCNCPAGTIPPLCTLPVLPSSSTGSGMPNTSSTGSSNSSTGGNTSDAHRQYNPPPKLLSLAWMLLILTLALHLELRLES